MDNHTHKNPATVLGILVPTNMGRADNNNKTMRACLDSSHPLKVNNMAWQTSNRRERLPANWPQLRTQVKHRAQGKCQATHHHPQCTGKGTDVDHINAGDNHNIDNLQLLSTACHKAKTAAENKARRKHQARLRKRPQEQHPGQLRRQQ